MKPKGSIIGVAILVGIGAWIGSHYIVKPKESDSVILAPPGKVVPAIVVPKPIEPEKPAEPVKPDLSKVPTKKLLAEFEAWQDANRDNMDAMPERVFFVWQELLKRPEIKWDERQSSGRRRGRR